MSEFYFKNPGKKKNPERKKTLCLYLSAPQPHVLWVVSPPHDLLLSEREECF